MKIFSFCFVFLFVVSCANNDAQEVANTNIIQIQDIGSLATTEYTFSKIVQLNDDKDWYKIGNRKILFSVKAKVKAGIDFNKVQPEDVTIDGKKSIHIKLPEAEILAFEINPDDVQTEMEDISGLRFEFSQQEKLKILKLGEKSIKEDMGKSAILQVAKKNTHAFLVDFYTNLGYESVTIETKSAKL
ncbi:MAG TPA: DUF4230 domain-containing protein [Taishania sp.]|nr:DUF4230 domain-containing protein [Taishania sp.]HNS41292.1 DUF4230 domain-containing protein [Taishania sp.]